MSSQHKVCPPFWTDHGNRHHPSNMETLEKPLNDGWKIPRVDTIPPTELPANAANATNIYILEKSEGTK